MKLRYRGNVYQTDNAQLETTVSNLEARFLGNTYFIRRSPRQFQPQLGLRKYRGVTYGN